MVAEEPSDGSVQVAAESDTDEFMVAVPGASGTLVRTGSGSAPTQVKVASVGTAQIALIDFRFPMVGTAEADGDHLIVCQMLHAPPGGRWDDTTLATGQTFVYPPGSSQVAVDPAGLCFGMVVVPWAEFETAASTLGLDPEPGLARHAIRPSTSNLLPSLLAPLGVPGAVVGPDDYDSLIDATARRVCRPTTARRRARRDRWASEDLVREAAGYLESCGGWIVPMLSLCRAVGVSERKLQLAFRDAFDVTPQQFMRLRALQGAHEALSRTDPGATRVATIAADHGFRHAGRFSSFYRSVFGVSPSATLHLRHRASR